MCAQIPRIETSVRFLILRHHKELWRTSNTGRLAALALPNSQLVSYGGPDSPRDFSALLGPESWLLFPSETPTPVKPPPSAQLVVLDASWTQARRMVHRMRELQGLPRFALAATYRAHRLRQPTVRDGMSTIEAMAKAVRLLETPDSLATADALEQLYSLRVNRSRQMKGLPELGKPG
jgi:DTW domain-containing protein YfiP